MAELESKGVTFVTWNDLKLKNFEKHGMRLFKKNLLKIPYLKKFTRVIQHLEKNMPFGVIEHI